MRSFKLLLVSVVMISVLCAGSAFADVTAKKTTNVKYRENGIEKTTVGDVYIIDKYFQPTEDNMAHDWYVVQGQTKFTDPLRFTNDSGVNIILEDGAVLEVSVTSSEFGVNVSPGSLTIYAQSTDRSEMGILSADVSYDYSFTIRVFNDLTIQGGIVKARASSANGVSSALYGHRGITVGADAVVEAAAYSQNIDANAIQSQGFVSSGDVTVIAESPSDCANGIKVDKDFVIVGGVCRAIATGRAIVPGWSISSGIIASGTAHVKGGWVESDPKIGGKMNHTGGALIDGDKGTVIGDTVIPAGMTATVRDGVELTIEDGAKLTVENDAQLTVEPGATLDTSKGTLDNKGKIENDGDVKLPAGTDISALNITGSGAIEKDGKTYNNSGQAYHTIKVTYGSGGTAGASASENVIQGTQITLTASPDVGYEFDKWVKNPTTLIIADNKSATFSMPDAPVEINATFKKIVYSITVDNDGNGTASADPTEATYGDIVKLSATHRDGWKFKEWERSPTTLQITGGANAEFTMPAQPVSVKATFEPLPPNEHEIIVDNDGNGIGWADYTAASKDVTVTLKATPHPGYVFVAWEVVSPTDLDITDDKFTMPDAPVKVVATFKRSPAPTPDIIISGDVMSVVIPAGKYKPGSTVVIDAGTLDGFTFAGWTGSVKFENPNSSRTSFIMPNGDVTLHANWKPKIGGNGAYTPLVSDDVQTWEAEESGDVQFLIFTPHKDLTNVMIDNEPLVRGTDWTAEEGSTLLTVKESALKKLKNGERKLTATFSNPVGTAEMKIVVSGNNAEPSASLSPSGEPKNGGGGCSAGAGLLSVLALLGLVKIRR